MGALVVGGDLEEGLELRALDLALRRRLVIEGTPEVFQRERVVQDADVDFLRKGAVAGGVAVGGGAILSAPVPGVALAGGAPPGSFGTGEPGVAGYFLDSLPDRPIGVNGFEIDMGRVEPGPFDFGQFASFTTLCELLRAGGPVGSMTVSTQIQHGPDRAARRSAMPATSTLTSNRRYRGSVSSSIVIASPGSTAVTRPQASTA